MSGEKLRGRRLGRHKLLIYKQHIVYFSCIYSEPINSTIKPYFRVRQQYPPVIYTHAAGGTTVIFNDKWLNLQRYVAPITSVLAASTTSSVMTFSSLISVV